MNCQLREKGFSNYPRVDDLGFCRHPKFLESTGSIETATGKHKRLEQLMTN